MRAIYLAALAAMAMLWSGVAAAQNAPPRAAPTQHVMVEQLTPLAALHFDAQKATAAYLAKVSPAERAKARAFSHGNHWLFGADVLLSLAICALLLFSRASAKMRNLAARATRSPFLQSLLYAGQFLIVVTALTLPLSYYEDFARAHAYGISNLTLGGWFGEFGIALALQLVIGSILIAIIYAVIRASRFWWAWGTLVAVIFLVIGMAVAPVFILPLFNSSTPLKPGPLRASIVRLAEANDVPSTNIYVVNTSKQSKLLNANVSGLFGTTRISLNDTLLSRCTPREILAVVAHEMGHYVLGHTFMILPWMALIILCGFGFMAWGSRALIAAAGGQWQIASVADVASLPLLYGLFTLFMVFAMPAVNSLSRTIETQADIFGLNAARQPDAFAKFFLLDAGTHEFSPGPLEEIYFWNHPSPADRIAMAMRWKAAHIHDPDIANGPVSPQ